jgi:hypothetical protein
MPENYILLERTELNASAASITFANIPQTGYTDLKVVASCRSDVGGPQIVNISFNGIATGYSAKVLEGNGSSASSSNASAWIFSTMDNADIFGNAEFYIPNYTSSNAKSYSSDSVTEANATTAYMPLIAGLWSYSGNPAITSITLTQNAGNFRANSTFSLYGIAAFGTTPVIAPKASGGNVIATDGTYWYHAFTSSGTFTPLQGITADVLVIAGGGGGGGSVGGGGGAGGVFYSASQSLSGTYSCTIGSGGTGGTSTGNGTQGQNSTFQGFTAAVGGGFGGGENGASSGSGGNGGSGGGTASNNSGGSAGTGTSGQGSDGSSSDFGGGTTSKGGAGGGGASGVGGAAGSKVGGNGGSGTNTYSSWATATSTGVSGFYAGGGSGGFGVGTGTSGTTNGGGGTAVAYPAAGNAGTISTGGGGAGGGQQDSPFNPANGGNGGSGIIIIRYPIA